MNRLVLLGLGLVVFIILAYFCVTHHVPIIEHDLRTGTVETLGNQGLAFAGVEVDGRDVTLKGSAVSEEMKRRALDLAITVRGVRVVHDEMTLSTGTPKHDPASLLGDATYYFDATYDPNQVRLSGMVPDEDSRRGLGELAATRFGSVPVETNLELNPGVPAGWSEATHALIKGLALSDAGEARLRPTAWTFRGKAADTDRRYAIQQLLKRDMPAPFRGAATLELNLSQQAIQCQQQFSSLLQGRRIQFEFNKTNIKAESHALLDELVAVAEACPTIQILIAGHTDAIGSDEVNQVISEARANAVKTYLQGKGIAAERLAAKGYGETRPLADNQTEAGQAMNRRIEFVVREPSL